MNNLISSFQNKNNNEMGNKQLERNLENIFHISNIKDNSFNQNHNFQFFDRPKCNYHEQKDSKINSFYNYTIPQKVSLGYNTLFEKKQENLHNKKINNENNIDLFKFNNSLPNNIYHNFSENTRYTKKKNLSTNFNINDRNNQEKKISVGAINGIKTQCSNAFLSYSSTR